MFISRLLAAVFLAGSTFATYIHYPRSFAQCQPIYTDFPPHSVSPHDSGSPASFVAISPEGSYQVNNGGLELYLERPDGPIKTKDGINNRVADGATVNSTFTLLYGKVTFEVVSPTVPGVVTAAILIADQRDEIDIELLGGDPAHWQTNIFAPALHATRPMYGVFSSRENIPSPDHTIAQLHSYGIDWSMDRIVWSVDGKDVRTLTKKQTLKDGTWHYPSHPARVQLGIWDASNPVGTAEWARGPIEWKDAPQKVKALIKSVTVECPGS